MKSDVILYVYQTTSVAVAKMGKTANILNESWEEMGSQFVLCTLQ